MRWVYDADGSIGPMPASPLLLPAILIYGLLSLIGIGGSRRNKIPLDTVPPRLLAHYRRRYMYLKTLQEIRPLTWGEEEELQKTQHPCGTDYPPIHYT